MNGYFLVYGYHCKGGGMTYPVSHKRGGVIFKCGHIHDPILSYPSQHNACNKTSEPKW
jgi:hypothetical protein